MKYHAYVYQCEDDHQSQVTWLDNTCRDTVNCSYCDKPAKILFGRCDATIEDDLDVTIEDNSEATLGEWYNFYHEAEILL